MGSVVHLRVLEGSMTEEPKGDTADGLTATGPEEPVTRAPASAARSSRGGTLRYLGPIREACRRRAIDSTDMAILVSIADMFSEGREYAFVPMRELASRAGCGRDTATARFATLVSRGILTVIGAWVPDNKGWGTIVDKARLNEGTKRRGLAAVVEISVTMLGAAQAPEVRSVRRPPTPKSTRSAVQPTDHVTVQPPRDVLVEPTRDVSVQPSRHVLDEPAREVQAGPTRSASHDPPLVSASGIRLDAPNGAGGGDEPPSTLRRGVEPPRPAPRPSVQATLPLALIDQPTVITAPPSSKPRRSTQKRLPTSDGRFRSSLIAAFIRGMTSPGIRYGYPKNRNADELVTIIEAHGPRGADPSAAVIWLEEVAQKFRLDGERRGWRSVRGGQTPMGLLQWMNDQASAEPLDRAIAGYVAGQKDATKQQYVLIESPGELDALALIVREFAEGGDIEARAMSVAKMSRAYRVACQADAKYEAGFPPSRCLRWLNNGRPQAKAQPTTFKNDHNAQGQKYADIQWAQLTAKPTTDAPKKDEEDD